MTRCRSNPDARPHPHACSWQHAQLVEDYRAARLAAEAAREAATNGYVAEYAGSMLTFRTWLTSSRGAAA